MAETKCPKCGAPLEFEVGTLISECSFCDSRVFIDRSGAHFFYILPFFNNAEQAVGIFRRWAAGPKKAKNLDALASVQRLVKQYFPLYMFRRRVGQAESVLVDPARATTVPGLRQLKIPPGDIKIHDKEFDTGNAEVLDPDIDVTAYTASLPGEPVEQALVHFPIWQIEYVFRGRTYSAVVDGSTGEVFADFFPVRGSLPYVAVSALGFGAFFGESLLMFLNLYLAVILMVVTLVGVAVGGVIVARKF